MLFSRKTAGLLLTGAMFIGLAAAAAPASASPSYFVIISGVVSSNDLCLQGATAGDGSTTVVQEVCDTGSEAQQWTPIGLGGSSYKLEYRAFGLCVDAHGGAARGTPITLWPCSASISNERWAWPHPFPDGFWPIGSQVAGSSGYCLDVPGGQALPGLGMQLWTCNGTAAQAWAIAGPVATG